MTVSEMIDALTRLVLDDPSVATLEMRCEGGYVWIEYLDVMTNPNAPEYRYVMV
jgi:hypothetical protein